MGVTEYNSAEPWVRQPFDTDLTWPLFQEYLAMPPPRRLGDLAKRPRFPLTWAQLETLAWEDGWKLRADCWDAHLDQLRIQTIEKVTEEDARSRAERQARGGKMLQELGTLTVGRLIKILKTNPDFGSTEVTTRDAIRAIGIGVRVERLALGDVTDRVDTGPDMSKLSVEDLRALRELQEKAGMHDA